MDLLFIYVFVAIAFSFLCSLLEAVLLSVNVAYIRKSINEGKPYGKLFKKWKSDIGKPLIAILTLNTIAHTVGAAGAGAQAALVFGNVYLGVFSAVLTLLILIFSEIIPKTLGAQYWRQLAPFSAFTLKYIIWFLYPFIKLAENITNSFKSEQTLSGFSREEFSLMADLSLEEGQLGEQESYFLKNLLRLRSIKVKDAMTPRTVIFSLNENLSVEEYYHKYSKNLFSRIPIYHNKSDNILGYVFRSDLLLAQARGNGQNSLNNYLRPIAIIPEMISISRILPRLVKERAHIMLVVDEYGSIQGIITLEDVIETALGVEIVDESDKKIDMQKEARKLWEKRSKAKGIDLDEE